VKSAVTICLVPEARSGPYVFHGGLEENLARATQHGFDGVVLFPQSAESIDVAELQRHLSRHRLSVAAIGTGAGRLLRNLTLTAEDQPVRADATTFIRSIIDLGGRLGAPAIIGWMQGRIEPHQDREQALDWLHDALNDLGQHAATHGVPLLLEPLNRYESNVLNTLGQTVAFVRSLSASNIRVLADLFHMNIEEVDLAAAIREAGPLLGHVDFADSNRRAVGLGHTDIGPVITALGEIGYTGYLAAEVFPLPTADAAAEQAMIAFRRAIGGN
jgi:sugar phosphate isomerase/epimerase